MGSLRHAPATAACLLSVPSSRNRLARFFIGRASALRLTLIPKLFAFCQRKFNLYSTIFEIHPRRNEREPLLLRLADQLADLFPMHEQFSSAQRSMIKDIPMLIGTDVSI